MSSTSPSVLLVDDDDVFRSVLARELTATGFRVTAISRGEEVEAALRVGTHDVVVLDLKMPGQDGLATLERVKAQRPLAEVVILTGHGSVESAVRALKLGAYDFLTKPCDLDHLESVIRRAFQARAMRSENETLRRALSRLGEESELVGRSPAMAELHALIDKVAGTDATVLIRGESGTGKEVIARIIHRCNARRDRPFVVVDCGATEENLVLSELFGHERGAFTGATQRRHGFFELADSGTVLIDEVGDAPLSLQSSLLRVLETGTFHRVGSEQPIAVNVRILAATHRDLEALVRAGTFREDLFFRLNVFSLDVPPLRDRRGDIPLLVDHFLARLGAGGRPPVAPAAMARLEAYRWPGNVRELRNVVERAVILSAGGPITPEHLPANLVSGTAPREATGDPPVSLKEAELRHVQTLVDRFDGDRARVAAALGVSQRTLYRKLRALQHRSRQK